MKRAFLYILVIIFYLGQSVLMPVLAEDKPLAFDSATEPTKTALTLLRITPDGKDVPPGRQIVFQFDRPVVPVGRMERDAKEIPITIEPAPRCEWRWINTSALACQLTEENALRYATRYSVLVELGIHSEDGATMDEPFSHHFITQRPKIAYASFDTWRAPGWPVIRLTFNQPVTLSSVKEHVKFETTLSKDYGIKITPAENDRSPIVYAPFPGEPYGLINPEYASETVDDRKTGHRGEEARRIWVVEPRQELPLDYYAYLNVDPGLVSALGPEPGIESRSVVEFKTYPEFSFLGIDCVSPSTEERQLLTPVFKSRDDLPEDISQCLPDHGVALVFSAPVINEEIKTNVRFAPDLAGGRKDYDPWANSPSYSRLNQPHRDERTYRIYLPEMLKAFHRYEITSRNVKDEFGRLLAEPIDMAFMTSHRLPHLVLPYNKAVLEKQVDTDVPLYITNLDLLKIPHRAITLESETDNSGYQVELEKVVDVSYARRLDVRKMLNGKSGAVVGHLSSEPETGHYHMNRFRFFAQVTPFQVHVKLGHFNSLAWITDLKTGEPVAGARVSVYADDYSLTKSVVTPGEKPAAAGPQEEKTLGQAFSDRLQNFLNELPFKSKYPEPEGTIASAVSDVDGLALLPGIETLNPDLNLLQYFGSDDRPRLFIRVDKDQDFGLVPLDNNFMTRAGGASSNNRPKNGHLHAWGTTAQGVYRAGDTIQYKFYVRNQSNRQWVRAPEGNYSLKVIDPKGEEVFEIESLKLSEFGAYSGEFKLGEQAAVGWYRFRLNYEKQRALEPIRVMVTDFTPAPFRVTTDLNGREYGPGDEISVTTLAQLHAGGPYTLPRTRTTVRLQRQMFRSENERAKHFTFDSPSYQSEIMLHQSSDTGNDHGEITTRFTLQDQNIYYGRIQAEGAVRDDRGKFVAAQTGANYYGRDRYVGLRNTAWTYEEDKNSAIEYLVVDRAGAPATGTQVNIKIEREQVKASRVKGAGNAYLTNYINEWVDVGVCQGVSALDAQTCAFVPAEPGSYRFTATITDGKKRVHTSQIRAWVIGKGRVHWQEPDNYTLQIIPEETQYKVGETARFLIKNPFPGARALITIERYGVLKHWTTILKENTPIIEVPIEPDYLHGFYLSVLINSPRVEQPLGDGNVDLGKPTFRLGYISMAVKDPYKEIAIQIKTDREVYKPRDKVKAHIQAQPRQEAGDQPIEIAALVIDEAVFDLNASGRGYYDPYQGFNRLDGLDLNNYSLLTRLIGRQKFEKKGANPGGDGEDGGGGDRGPTLRNLFKFISYWNPAIVPDKSGNAEIEFELPDNLTGWRVFALAVTPDDRMGLGDAAIKVNQPTELRPVMPNQVTEGDSFVAGFSVMNRTEKPRTVTVEISAAGVVDPAVANRSSAQLTLEPYKRQTVWLPVKTKGAGVVDFRASARDGQDGDAIAHQVSVNKRRSLVTAANYGTTTQPKTTDLIAFPEKIYSDTGGLSVVTSPSIIGNIEGAFDYVRDYPYLCWEQRLTKAVMASHYNNLRAYLPDSLLWENSQVLPQTILDQAGAFQAPNGGMTYWLPTDSYVSPYLSAYTALAFNWLRKSGYTVPQNVEHKLHKYLSGMLRRDEMPTFFSQGMASSVRAVALAALAVHGSIGMGELTRHESHLPEMDLFGKAHFLLAAGSVDGGRPIALKTAKLILNHASQSGGKFQFNEPWDDGYLYLLSTPLRSNCVILSSLMHITTDTETLGLVGDIPFKQVRAITQSRGNRNHWENTQENVFCMNALTDYARVYEKEKPDMSISVSVGPRKIGETRYTDLRDKAATFEDRITKASPGLKTEVAINKQGPGRLYYSTRISYAPTIDNVKPVNSGIEIRREYAVERNSSWELLKNPMQIRRGELVRIDIFVSIPTARHFVVVDDPVPGGLEPVNRDLATASIIDSDKGKFQAAKDSFWFSYGDWSYYGRYGYSFYHKELRHNAARFYADYLPAGNYHLSYTAQAIAAGEFSVMPVHAEEMYDPDVFGKGLAGILKVSQE